MRALIALFLAICCLLFFGCRSPEASSAGAKNKTTENSVSRQPALSVRVSPVEVRDVAYRVKTLGSLEPEELVQVTAQVNGAVTKVQFDAGDHVSLQTLLVRIDPERYRLQAERGEAEYRRAVADRQRAEAEMKRREALALDGLVSDEELYRAQQETERLSAVAASSKAALDLARQDQQRSEVRSPRAGVISSRSVATGQFVQVGAVLATLVDISRLRLRFKVSDAESLRLKQGQNVVFRVSSLGDRDFTAGIYYVGEVADAATRQVEVLAWVKNPGVLKPGFFAEVSLDTQSHKNAVVVPESAVQASEQGFVVYAVNEGSAKLRVVQVGLRTGDGTVEILSGLKPGEIVVSEGSDRLADGVAVQPVNEGASNKAQGATQ